MALKIICTLLAVVFVVGYANAASSGKAVRLVFDPNINMPTAFLCRYALPDISSSCCSKVGGLSPGSMLSGIRPALLWCHGPHGYLNIV